MIEPVAVTTFGPMGWKPYAEKGIHSFCQHWPGPVIAYYEDTQPDYQHERLEWRRLWECEGLMPVLDWAKKSPALQGRQPNGDYNYNFNLYKFCRKVFAQVDAGLRHCGQLWWLDADVILLKPIPTDVLDAALANVYTCALFREGFHIESGVVGWDTSHAINNAFMNRYRDLFTSGTILQLPGYHDCWAYMEALTYTKAPYKNLSPEAKGHGPVIKMSPFRALLTHDKGERKFGREQHE